MASAEAVAAVVEAGGAHVPGLMDALEDRLVAVAGSHGATLGEHATATIAAGGKRLRPLLVFVAAGPAAAGHDAALRAAVAVELVHSATLVHDDVLDAAVLRRGRPTVVAAAGRSIATATGDLLFSRAFAELAGGGSADAVRVLSDASSALVQGELLQREDAWKLQTTRERYLRRCDLKTARLFRAACELGALAGGGNVALLGEFGERIGLAFQLLDDVLDVSGPAERTGKHRGTDLLDGTVTLPLILARERDPELAQLDLRAVRTPEQAEGVCDAIAATGALDAARGEALAMVAEAKADLPALPEPSQQAALELVADGVVDRYLLEIFGEDGAGLEGGGEAVSFGLHVRLHEAAEVLDEGVGAEVQVLVEAVDGGLVVRADLAPLAVRAAELDLPVRRGGLFPVGRVDEVLVALRADAEVDDRRGRRHRGLARGFGGERLKVDDLDLPPRGQRDASDVLAVGVGGLAHDLEEVVPKGLVDDLPPGIRPPFHELDLSATRDAASLGTRDASPTRTPAERSRCQTSDPWSSRSSL